MVRQPYATSSSATVASTAAAASTAIAASAAVFAPTAIAISSSIAVAGFARIGAGAGGGRVPASHPGSVLRAVHVLVPLLLPRSVAPATIRSEKPIAIKGSAAWQRRLRREVRYIDYGGHVPTRGQPLPWTRDVETPADVAHRGHPSSADYIVDGSEVPASWGTSRELRRSWRQQASFPARDAFRFRRRRGAPKKQRRRDRLIVGNDAERLVRQRLRPSSVAELTRRQARKRAAWEPPKKQPGSPMVDVKAGVVLGAFVFKKIDGATHAELPYVQLPSGVPASNRTGYWKILLNCSKPTSVSFNAEIMTPEPKSSTLWITLDGQQKKKWDTGMAYDWAWSMESPALVSSPGWHRLKLEARNSGIMMKTLTFTTGAPDCELHRLGSCDKDYATCPNGFVTRASHAKLPLGHCEGEVCRVEECCYNLPQCAANSCGPGFTLADPIRPKFCNDLVCKVEECCTPRARCKDRSCPWQSHMMKTWAEGLVEYCENSECTLQECCIVKGNCAGHSCPEAWIAKDFFMRPEFCESKHCRHTECCLRLGVCTANICTGGHALLRSAPPYCMAEDCTTQECCGKLASCEDQMCQLSQGYVPKPDAALYCRNTYCEREECCLRAGYCSKDIQCAPWQRLTPSFVYCKQPTCTREECCVELFNSKKEYLFGLKILRDRETKAPVPQVESKKAIKTEGKPEVVHEAPAKSSCHERLALRVSSLVIGPGQPRLSPPVVVATLWQVLSSPLALALLLPLLL